MMIDLEPLLPLLTAIEAAAGPWRVIVAAYKQITSPSAEQTKNFIDDYLKASSDWANACGALATSVCTAAEEAKLRDA